MELAQECCISEFLAEWPVWEPESGEPDEGVYRTRLDEPLLPTAGLVGVGRDRDFLRRRRSAHLAAPDAPAAEPLLPEPRPCKLAEVAVPRARDDQFCRNVPLDSLEADVLREERFCVGDKIDQLLLGVGPVLPPLPEGLDLGSRSNQGRVDL